MEETNDIHLHFTEVLDLPNDKAEELIEKAFGVIPRVYELALRGLGLVTDVRVLWGDVRSIFSNEELDVETPDTELLITFTNGSSVGIQWNLSGYIPGPGS